MTDTIVYTPQDLQRLFLCGKNQAYALCNRADFPAIRIGKKILIPRDALLRWLDEQTKKAGGMRDQHL